MPLGRHHTHAPRAPSYPCPQGAIIPMPLGRHHTHAFMAPSYPCPQGAIITMPPGRQHPSPQGINNPALEGTQSDNHEIEPMNRMDDESDVNDPMDTIRD